MSTWVPMDLKKDILESIAEAQGIELPAHLLSPLPSHPKPPENREQETGVVSRKSLKRSFCTMTKEQYLSFADVYGGLVSTRKRLRIELPVKEPEPVEQPEEEPKGEPGKEPEKEPDEDEVLYGKETKTTTAPAINYPFSGTQYLNEPLFANDDETGDDAIARVPAKIDNESTNNADIESTKTSAESEAPVIPLIGDDGRDNENA